MIGCLALSGCFPRPVPLASMPMDHPKDTDLNLTGMDQSQAGQWVEILESFNPAVQIDQDFVKAYFNAKLTSHQMDRHEETTRYFQRAEEVAIRNGAIVHSALSWNHSGLFSMLERHLVGGYCYQP